MLNELLEIFCENGITSLVIDKNLKYKFDEKLVFDEVELINDVRSGTFYSLGKAKLKNVRPIVYLVSSTNLSSTYTGLTEAWFQKANIIVVAVYSSETNINNTYLDVCLNNKLTLKNEDLRSDNRQIIDLINSTGVSLINIFEDVLEVMKYDYSLIIDKIRSLNLVNNNIFCYNATDTLERQFKNIKPEYKYGVISKFVGYVVGRDENSLLCCPANLLVLDINIFNIRYITNKMKMIFYNYNKELKDKNIADWITNNGIRCITRKSINDINDIINDFDVIFVEENL